MDPFACYTIVVIERGHGERTRYLNLKILVLSLGVGSIYLDQRRECNRRYVGTHTHCNDGLHGQLQTPSIDPIPSVLDHALQQLDLCLHCDVRLHPEFDERREVE